MNIKEYESLIKNEISEVIENIINRNIGLDISAKSRAEISTFLEGQFVSSTQKNANLINAEKSRKGATKDPWDARVDFKYKNYLEEIWIDFKIIKINRSNSNPDIGTPTKIIDFIQNGGFYLLYIYVFYKETKNGLRFCKVNDSYVKSYFLKDVHESFRRNAKNQLQVDISTNPEYRSREEFIKLLFTKLKESHQRQIKKNEEELKTLDDKEKQTQERNKQTQEKQENILLKIKKS